MSKLQTTESVMLTEYLHQRATANNIPINGTFELTPTCNFACRMCYVRKTMPEVLASPRPMMTLEQWLALAEEARKQGMLYILLTGGEPTQWQDFWELYEKLAEIGFLISVNTNGTFLDEAAVEKLQQHPPRRLNITIYGTSDETYERLCCVKGGFTRFDRAITLLQKAGIMVKLNCSLTPYNVCELESMIRYANERDLVLDVNPYMFPPTRRAPELVGQNDRLTAEEAAKYRLEAYRLQHGEEAYHTHLKSILAGTVPPPGLDENCIDPLDGRIHCRAGKASFWVTWDGWLLPCGMVPEPKLDIHGRSFAESWKQINEISRKLALSGVCEKCPNRRLCHSCAAMAAAETGSVSGIPNYLCEMVQEMKNIAERELGKNSKKQ